uniref:Uncharacterized protein n=1 Tax=Pediastrum angulosum TaxID=271408 RepID=A0A2U8GHV7_9CHLO|nr:hypothetical protein [Pediastrum angulosum]
MQRSKKPSAFGTAVAAEHVCFEAHRFGASASPNARPNCRKRNRRLLHLGCTWLLWHSQVHPKALKRKNKHALVFCFFTFIEDKAKNWKQSIINLCIINLFRNQKISRKFLEPDKKFNA